MPPIALHQPVPDFTLPATSKQQITLSHFRGKFVVLYFYPKDCTPGCTQQAEDFRDYFTQFRAHQAVILGVSRDNLALHEKFKADHQLPFPLLSDPDETVCQLFEVVKDKILYGRKVRGIERSTFLIDKQGILQQVWRKVKVAGHVNEVLTAIEALA